jgi:hypothetical protein
MTEETKNKILVPDVKDPELRAVLERIAALGEKNCTQYEELKKLKTELIEAEPSPEQQYFSFFPIELMRTSIFFPLRHDELNREHRKISKITIKHSWGELEIEGVKLAIYQEDILLRILMERKNAVNSEDEIDKKKYSGFKVMVKLNHIAKGINKKSGANKRDKQRVLDALTDFQLINFKINRPKDISSVGSIVRSWVYHKDTDLLDIYFNPDFWTLFGEGMLACVNLNKRQELQGDCAKALLRFIQAHKKPNTLNIITIMQALNYNVNQPPSDLATILKRGIKELIKIGELSKKSHITKNYIVFLEYPDTKAPAKIKK